MITLKFLSNMKVILGIIYVRKDVVEKEIGTALTVSANHCCVLNVAVQIILGIHFIVLRFGVGSNSPLLRYQHQESSYIHLGHGGQPCPNAIWPWDDTWVDDPDDSTEEDIDDPSLADPTVPPAFNNILSSMEHGNEQSHGKKHYNAHGNPLMTIVDRSGVHRLAIQPYHCHGHPPIHHQLLQIGLYPATQTSPRTAFTFAILDDFRLMCKVSEMPFLVIFAM